MDMYALGLMPLLIAVNLITSNIVQVAFADDITGVGRILDLKEWWNAINRLGPYLGYYIKADKSWLIVKEQHLEAAKTAFHDSEIKITTDGHRHLGAVVGSVNNKEKFINEKVESWVNEVRKLSEIAHTEPHAAFSAFVHGLRHKFTFIMRTVPDISNLLNPLDLEIDRFIMVLMQGYCFNETERLLFSLPPKHGGLGIIIPSAISDREYQN